MVLWVLVIFYFKLMNESNCEVAVDLGGSALKISVLP